MKRTVCIVLSAMAVGALGIPPRDASALVVPLGNAFTYQGKLEEGGSPFSGLADFQFRLFDGSGGGALPVGPVVPMAAVTVTDGIFTVNLDFGAVFNGEERWIEIAVDTPPLGGFVTLGPRRLITPSPVALFAMGVNGSTITGLNASNLASGTVPGARVGGAYGNAVNFSNAGNAFTGSFSGSGAGLTSLSASNISVGTLPIARGGTGAGTAATALANLSGIDDVNTAGGSGLAGGATSGAVNLSIAPNGVVNTMLASDAASLLKVSGGAMQSNGSSIGIGGAPGGWLHGQFAGNSYLRAEKTGTGGSFGARFTSPDLDWWLLMDPGLGPDDAFTIYNGTIRMSIMETGQVGIGTGTNVPAAMLEVLGTETLKVGDASGEIFLNGTTGTITGNGSDGLENWRLWNGGYGELWLFDSAVANNLTVDLAASGSFLNLFNPNNSARINLDGDEGGETRISLFNDLGNNTVFIDTDGSNAGRMIVKNSTGENKVNVTTEGVGASSSGNIYVYNEAGLISVEIDGDFGSSGDGRVITDELQITGGADLSEQFDIATNDDHAKVEPGMVVCIDPDKPGELLVSVKAYDRLVAGIISGANGIKPGMLMGQKKTEADGQHPVALTGRVYVRCTDANGSIEPGDLLTSSDESGMAMRVTDYAKAQGAIIGKAMTRMDEKTGMVLVLVGLQ